MAVNSRTVPHLRVVGGGGAPGRQGEELLAKAWAANEPWAVEAMWKRYAPLIFSLLQTGLGEPARAELLTRRVFSDGLRRAQRANRRGNFPRVLVGCAARTLCRELMRDYLRRIVFFGRRREPLVLVSNRLGARDSLALRRLYEVLDRLGPWQRTLFVLFELEGFGVLEIADALGLSTVAAERKVRRASARFENLAENDPVLSEYIKGVRAPSLELQEGA